MNNRVLLVDDENMLLDSLEIILSMNGCEIVGKAHDGIEALSVLEKESCDLALVDLNMKGMGGIELIAKMKKLYPEVKILVLTTFYDDKNITEAISGGADGYLLKDSGKDAILGAIKQLSGGNTVLDGKVMQRLTALVSGNGKSPSSAESPAGSTTASSVLSGNKVASAPDHGVKNGTAADVFSEELTQREKEICTLLAEGLSNKQIAEKLYISEGTVKNYISVIYDKTGIHDRVQLAISLRN